MKWKDLTGEERYRVVELARKGERPLTKICAEFGVSRQTLTKAMALATEGAKAALQPKKPGRKGKSEETRQITELSKKQSSMEKEIEHWKTRYEVAQAYIDIVHEQEVREERTERNRKKRARKQQKKKPRNFSGKKTRAQGAISEATGVPAMAGENGVSNFGDPANQPHTLEGEARTNG